jgi:hypothetical protein
MVAWRAVGRSPELAGPLVGPSPVTAFREIVVAILGVESNFGTAAGGF